MANLSKIKRDSLIDKIENLKMKNKKDEDTTLLLNEIINELTGKKYGLVWEQHEENVDKKMETAIPVFDEIKEREICGNPDEKKINFLLEGDNLHSLKLLEKTHKGRIDVIYIDPPYNTGNEDFVYMDKFVKKEDAYRHSMWLSFMSERLSIAYNLLKEDGLIFLSIDDNEFSQLKILMDEIFTEENFVLSMPRITKKSGKTTTAYAKNHDYILVYTKRNQDIFTMEEHSDPAFKYSDEFEKKRGKYKLNQTLDYDSLSYSSSLDYPLEVEGETFYAGGDIEKWKERKAGNHKRADWAWRWSKKLFDFGYKNGFVVIKRKDDGSARIYTKTYLNAKIDKDENGEPCIIYNKRTKATSSIEFINNIYSNDNAKKDLKAFGLEDEFDYSKPVALIKKLIKAYYRKDAIILDFFAGSGTTGQAVMELNLEDGGNRRFILCTNNQNNICEAVTYKRISDVINTYHYQKCTEDVLFEHEIKLKDIKDSTELLENIDSIKKENKDQFKKFQTKVVDGIIKLIGKTEVVDLTGIPANLKYYKTDFVDKYSDDPDYFIEDKLMEHIVEMIQLENGIRIDNDKYVVLLTDEEAEEFESNIDSYHPIKIYIDGTVFLSQKIKNKLDTEGVEILPIPDYYFAKDIKGGN